MPHLWKTAGHSLTRWLGGALARLTPSEIEDLAANLARESLTPRQHDAMTTFARALLANAAGQPYDMAANGEGLLLERTSDLGYRTLFDVGANRGHWTLAARRAQPAARIHCFEIVPSTFELLRATLAGQEGVELNPFGLSEQDGEVEVFATTDTAISSLYDWGNPTAVRTLCRVMRGDSYCAERGIERVDILKIDTEGAEALVLKGFSGMLAAGRIGLVQFEYNRGAIESHFLLRDFHAFFGAHGYAVGKLTGDGVLFREYHHSQEDFVGPNCVACRADDQALIGRIAVPR
jgi:FkbM family methyltransferase